jgi:hypothetical protein
MPRIEGREIRPKGLPRRIVPGLAEALGEQNLQNQQNHSGKICLFCPKNLTIRVIREWS